MAEIKNQSFFIFLASFGDNNAWVSAADQDGDKKIIRSEFYDFIKAQWNGEETPSDDLITGFWRNVMDTNKSIDKIKGTKLRNLNALDSTEMKNMEVNLEIYVQFNNLRKTILDNRFDPTKVLKNDKHIKSWKADMREVLENTFCNLVENNQVKISELNELLEQTFDTNLITTLAPYVKDEIFELKDLIQKPLEKYENYYINNDSDLRFIIENATYKFINNIDAITNPSGSYSDLNQLAINFRSELTTIISNYVTNSLSLEKVEEQKEKTYELQKAVLQEKAIELIENSKAAIIANIDGIKDAHPIIQDDFWSLYLLNLPNNITSFVNSITTKYMANPMEINIDAEASIIADKIIIAPLSFASQADVDFILNKYVPAKSVAEYCVNTYIKSLNQGEETEAIWFEVFNEIGIKAINSFYDQIMDNSLSFNNDQNLLHTFCVEFMRGEALSSLKDSFENSQTDYERLGVNNNLSNYKYSCITKLEKLFLFPEPNGGYKLGNKTLTYENYKDIISGYINGSELFVDMKTLIASITPVDYTSNITWSGISAIELFGSEKTKSFPIRAHVNNIDDQSKISYSIKSSSNIQAYIDSSTGKLIVTRNTDTSAGSIEIRAIVNGIPIGKAMVVNIISSYQDVIVPNEYQWGNDLYGNVDNSVVDYIEAKDKNNAKATNLSKYSFWEYYQKDAIFQLNIQYDNDKSWSNSSDAKTAINNALNDLIKRIEQHLNSSTNLRMDYNKLSVACAKVYSKYSSTTPHETVSAYGTSNDENRGNVLKIYSGQDVGPRMICANDDTCSDTRIYAIHFKKLVDTILEEYNKLILI